jgi:hypothetical protein
VSSDAVEELERQIDNTRGALDRTLRALQFELSPRHRAQVAWRRTKRRTEHSLRVGADWAVANRVAVSLGAVLVVAACVAGASRREKR